MYDLVVIGSGPGGYVSASRAAQLGMKVACIEKYYTYGGTCLNVGCIPSKALLESSERYEEAQHVLADHGVDLGEVKLNLEKMMARKTDVVGQLTGGVKFLFKKNGVEGKTGVGTIVGPNKVKVVGANGEEELETKRILIATGSRPSSIPGVAIDKDRIVDSTGALEFDAVPEHLVVIGAGVIGLELGSVWARLGAKVTVLEWLPKIARNSGVPKEHWETVNTSANELRTLFEQVHQNIDNKQDPNFAAVAGDIDQKVAGLEEIATAEPAATGTEE